MKTKKYQIFVSSTYGDLIEERKEITQAILKCGCIPAGMELWPPSTILRWQVIQSVIDDSDYYVLILAGKYGSEKAGEQGEENQLHRNGIRLCRENGQTYTGFAA